MIIEEREPLVPPHHPHPPHSHPPHVSTTPTSTVVVVGERVEEPSAPPSNDKV